MPKAYGYIRVSTLDQAEQGHSLDVQEEKLRTHFEYRKKYCATLGEVQWGGCFIERGKSAYKITLIARPEGAKLHQALAPGDHVFFVRLDRSFRTVRDFCNTLPLWDGRQITMHFVDNQIDMSTANGRLVAHIMASVAEWESSVKSERIRETIAWMQEQGLYSGHNRAPRGTKVVKVRGQKRLVVDRRFLCIARLSYWWLIRTPKRKRSRGSISDRLEEFLAEREGRRMIPRFYDENREFSRRVLQNAWKKKPWIRERGRNGESAA